MRASFAFALFFVAAPLIAADGEWTRSSGATVESEFVRRGIERASATVTPAVLFTDDAWRLTAEAAVPFDGARRGEFVARFGRTLVFDSGMKLGLEVAHFRFGEPEGGHPSHATEFAASLSIPAGPGMAIASFTRDVDRRADIAELSYGGEYALKTWGAFLNYRFYAGAIAADDVLPHAGGITLRVADSYSYHGVDLTLPYRIGGQTIVTAGVHYAGTNGARPLWSPSGASPGAKVWLSLAASYEF
jgi:hypothetical protein